MRTKEITNCDDVIDSRDVIARIVYLEGTEDEDEQVESAKLKALAEEAEGYCEDWRHGATLINESYFTEYAEQLASDIGDYNPNKVQWPYNHIDWEEAADELKQDYTQVDFDGITYFVR